jgi:uncharacterized protein YjiK
MKNMDIHIRMVRLITTLFVLVCFIGMPGCGSDKQEPEPGVNITLTSSYALTVDEPSGLALAADGQSLYTVSDQTNRIYHLNLTGETIATLPYVGDDLEGIAYDSRTGNLWVVEEQLAEIVELNPAGYLRARHPVDFGMEAMPALEGICFQGAAAEIFVLQEKNPPRILRLSDYAIAESWQPEFALDFSGITADAVSGRFWIVSDESGNLVNWDLSDGVIDQFSLGFTKAEGVAFDGDKTIYVVSEAEARLYVFSLD